MRVWLVLLVVATVSLSGSARAGSAESGRALYDARCAFCHGAAGKGDGPAGAALKPSPTNFAAADYWKTAKLDVLRAVIKNGKPDTAMVPFGATLSDADIENLLATLQAFSKK